MWYSWLTFSNNSGHPSTHHNCLGVSLHALGVFFSFGYERRCWQRGGSVRLQAESRRVLHARNMLCRTKCCSMAIPSLTLLTNLNKFETKRCDRFLAPFIFYEFVSFSSEVRLPNARRSCHLSANMRPSFPAPQQPHTQPAVASSKFIFRLRTPARLTVQSVCARVWVACSHIAYYKVTTLRRRVMDSRYEIMLSWYPLGRRICSPSNLCAPGTALFVFRVSAGQESSSCEAVYWSV